MAVKNQVQLITYPDSLGGDLKALHGVLDTYFPDVFGGIHILPPFPSSQDRGFAPLTHLKIDAQFGTWDDIQRLGAEYDLLLDLVINHISSQSVYFQDFLAHGKDSEDADLFIPIEKIWPDGNPPREEIEMIFLRRETPFSEFPVGEDGKIEKIWTSFGKTTPSGQIDLDVSSEHTRGLLVSFLENFSRHNVKIARLDAVGYVIKKRGTTCFFVEPEIYQFLDWITEVADKLDITLLPEVHARYETQFKLAERGHWIYDFILPYMVLHTLTSRTNRELYQYLKTRPHNQFTMLDCHDGVPIKPDLNSIYNSDEAKRLVELCVERGSNLSLIFSPKHKDPDGFDVHQIRGTYYSMLDCNDDAYLAARAIQFFTPGVPQVYYVGLLAGQNDQESFKQSGEGRDINRHNFSLTEIEEASHKEVVQRLVRLIKFRNQHPAFAGEFQVEAEGETRLLMSWSHQSQSCSLRIDLETYASEIHYTDESGAEAKFLV